MNDWAPWPKIVEISTVEVVRYTSFWLYTFFWLKRFMNDWAPWPKIVGNFYGRGCQVYLFLAKTFSEWLGSLSQNRRNFYGRGCKAYLFLVWNVFWMTGLVEISTVEVVRYTSFWLYTFFWLKRFMNDWAPWPKIVGNFYGRGCQVYLFLAKTFSERLGSLSQSRRNFYGKGCKAYLSLVWNVFWMTGLLDSKSSEISSYFLYEICSILNLQGVNMTGHLTVHRVQIVLFLFFFTSALFRWEYEKDRGACASGKSLWN